MQSKKNYFTTLSLKIFFSLKRKLRFNGKSGWEAKNIALLKGHKSICKHSNAFILKIFSNIEAKINGVKKLNKRQENIKI